MRPALVVRSFLVSVIALGLAVTAPAVPGVSAAAPDGQRATASVLSANLWANNKRPQSARNTIRDLRPLVAGLQEGRGHRGFGVRGYRKISGPGWRRENPVLVRTGPAVTIQSWEFVRLTARIGKGYIRAPRSATIVRLRWSGRPWAVVNTHLPVVSRTQRPNPSRSAVARQYRAGMRKVLAIADEERRAGRRVLLTGDLNDMPRPGIGAWRWHPSRALPKAGLVYRRAGVDYVATPRKADAFASHRVVPKRTTGSDHPWLLARIRW